MARLPRGVSYGSGRTGFSRGGSVIGARGYVTFNWPLIYAMEYRIPIAAHNSAVSIAARAAADAARGPYSTGALEADVAKPKRLGGLISYVGSGLVYAAIENTGGTVTAHEGGRLLIHDESDNIVASAKSIHIAGKHYLQRAVEVYVTAVQAFLAGGYGGLGALR